MTAHGPTQAQMKRAIDLARKEGLPAVVVKRGDVEVRFEVDKPKEEQSRADKLFGVAAE